MLPTSVSSGYDRDLRTLTVQEDGNCSYMVSTDRDWLTVEATTVAGDGAVKLEVAYNDGRARMGTLSIGSRTVSVAQDGEPAPPDQETCYYGVFPDSIHVSNEGSQGNIDVTWRYVADETFPDPPDDTDDQESGCVTWAPTSVSSWVSVAKYDATTATYIIDVNDDNEAPGREASIRIGDRTIRVFQGVPPLTRKRDELLRLWAAERHGGDLCTGWDDVGPKGRAVFIWITHRLHITNLLQDVTGLYSITGSDGDSCGGAGYNRTYMSMSPSLHARLVRTARGESTVPEWRETHDPACGWADPLLPAPCPHPPFNHQVETEDDGPTGQIQLFEPGLVSVVREHFQGTDSEGRLVRSCGVAPWRVHLKAADVCEEEYCTQREHAVGACTGSSQYRDSDQRSAYSYELQYDGNYKIDDAYSFEMDQDYNILFHHSAPWCDGGDTDMRPEYAKKYGDPGWTWAPSDCPKGREPGGVFTDSVPGQGGAGTRAVYIEELRARIGGLRRRWDLPPFVWTDPAISYGVTAVKAVHLSELRTALGQAYAVAGPGAPVYTDVTIVAGVTPIKAAHLTELRAAIVALEEQ